MGRTRSGASLLVASMLTAATVVIAAGPAAAAADDVWADFDGDGFSDLAVGVPGEDVNDWNEAGAVNVLYGSAGGLSDIADQHWTQDTTGVLDAAEQSDRFGAALAAGDFDGDGFDDLAIGAPDESVLRASDGRTVSSAGAVSVLYGSADGLTAADDQLWSQETTGVPGTPGTFDRFGYSLRAADFDGDGMDDLAVGVPNENLVFADSSRATDHGVADVLYGSASGLTATGAQVWHQARPGVEGAAESFEYLAEALGGGDFNGDGFDDLALGARGEGIGSIPQAGAVNVIYGSAAGLDAAGDQIWHQNRPDVEGTAETSDSFGLAIAAGDFDGDGTDDLAIGVPYEWASARIATTGAVNVLYGSGSGLTATGDQQWEQATADVEGDPEDSDLFGSTLAAGDFDDDGFADLAVGVPNEWINAVRQAGAVNVIYGSGSGLDAAADQFWSQGTSGIENGMEDFDRFGSSLAAGDFDGDGSADLVVGVPGEGLTDAADAGAAHAIYGTGAGLSSTDSQLWTQGVDGIESDPGTQESFASALAG